MKDLLDVHTHTLASGHAYNTIYELAYAAKEKKLELLGITEHAPKMPGTCYDYYFMNLHVMPREIAGLPVLFGAELNILDFKGTIDLSEEILKEMDLCIASIHPPCFKAGTVEENTKAAMMAMNNRHVTIIGHPDDARFPLDYKQIAAEAARTHTLLEVNNSSLAPNGYRVNSRENYIIMLEECMKREVCVVMNSDAHTATDIGNHKFAASLLEEVGFPQELIANTSIDKFRAYLRK